MVQRGAYPYHRCEQRLGHAASLRCLSEPTPWAPLRPLVFPGPRPNTHSISVLPSDPLCHLHLTKDIIHKTHPLKLGCSQIIMENNIRFFTHAHARYAFARLPKVGSPITEHLSSNNLDFWLIEVREKSEGLAKHAEHWTHFIKLYINFTGIISRG